MDRLSSAGMLGARILLSSAFLHAGIRKVFAYSATQEYMARHGMKMTGLFALLAILIEIAGGLSVLLGYYPRLGAAALFLFLIPTTAVFHRDFSSSAQLVQFSKNVAIMGGLLAVVAAGGGEFTVRRKGGGA
ncbi:MAG TPA: DoxX family protein [Candidatus Aquicultoraceae bacterium]|jgi:putative oxidoreductase|nr:DoxX family protein [Candidatus Aquicultoraceae bacterium]